ncbi:DHH family phosphoesterase [[Clostridium] colinum]|uniref:DHH family phosphoesterase n=1 Tax=[Clostridium] colinum TaxID=36835 RepID=UPI00202537A5|nr:DHH family phosphoesterase [[Clostridium] colinum]
MKNFDNIPFSVLKIAPDGVFISYNCTFEKNILPYVDEKCNIKSLIENFNFDKEEQQCVINQKGYNIIVRKSEQNYDLFFTEIKILDEYKTTVGLIVIDNYDEVLDSLEEFRHPLILAIVDRKIKKMAKDLGGVVKKFEKDKYILILSQQSLDELKEERFNILDSIREIDMGNTIPVTLSIGIGTNGENLDENMEYARVSIDLALSRGGDQVVIKSGENYQFFGGHAKEGNRNSRVRARVKAYALTELIEDASNVLIMGHRYTDLDCMGAGIGVYSIVSALEKKCKIVLNDITSSVSYLYDRISADEKYKDVFISSEEALKLVNRKTLLIIVDVYKAYLCECPELIDKAKKIVVFDHHRKGVDYIENAVLTYHEPYASSTCELITEMLMHINKNIPIKQVEADAILAGIIVDTKNFAFKTGIKTFEAAAFLKKKGADTIRVKKLFKNSLDCYNARANVVTNMKEYRENIAISVLEDYIDNPLLVVAQACDELLNIDNINASFVLCKLDNIISISARSFGEINVQIIMEKLGGGGHQSISATQIENVTIEQAIDMLKEAIDEYFKEEE